MRSTARIRHGAAWWVLAALACGVGAAADAQEPDAPAPPATAPAPADDAAARELAGQWADFIHYIRLARADAAESFGRAIVAANPDPATLYRLAMKTDPAGETLARGRNIKRLVPVIDQIKAIIDRGALEVRRNPAEIRRWIEMLAEGPRAFMIARGNLIRSGEYAVPQMIAKLADRETSDLLRERITVVLPRLGKEAVRPLVEVLLGSPDANVQEVAARTLGKIGYPHAAPHLQEFVQRKGVVAPVRDAARGALADCAGKRALKKPAAELFYDVAEKYYRGDESILPDARYDTANVWFWKDELGVTFRAVPREIFNDVYAKRLARRALAHDESFYPAVVLWLAAAVRAETSMPEGASNPFQPADEPGADFYLRAAPAKYVQMVLSRALADGDVAVAVRAIEALRETVGAENLIRKIDELGGAQPLVAALTYPSRLVRYRAAEALAKARPTKRFTGSHLVVPVLIEALRQTGTPTAVLADPDQDRHNRVKDLLRAAGYRVEDDVALGPALARAREGGGVDLFVLASNITAPGLAEAMRQIRSEAVLGRVPVVVAAAGGDVLTARDLAKGDPAMIVVADDELDAAKLAEVLKPYRDAALSPEDAAAWAIRAAGCIELLAGTNNPVYDLTEAVKALAAALTDPRDPVRIAAAGALGKVRSTEAQRALVAPSVDGAPPKEVRLAALAALAESVRLYGNELTEKQIDAIITVVTSKGDLDIRRAGAQALGALSLPSEKIKQLIRSAPSP